MKEQVGDMLSKYEENIKTMSNNENVSNTESQETMIHVVPPLLAFVAVD